MRIFVLSALIGILAGCAVNEEGIPAAEKAWVAPEDREIVEREIARRRAKLVEADAALKEGDVLMKDGDIEGARKWYHRAVDLGR